MKNTGNYFSFLTSHFSFQAGFTLIEIMIVFSIIGILSVISIAGFTVFNETQSLQTSASDVASLLNLAKSRALSQVVASCPDTLKGYEVKFSLPSTYELWVRCDVSSISIESKKLPKNIEFTSGTTSLFFFPVITGGGTVGQIILEGYGRSKTIDVDEMGNIKISVI